jgi:hypothetical protein
VRGEKKYTRTGSFTSFKPLEKIDVSRSKIKIFLSSQKWQRGHVVLFELFQFNSFVLEFSQNGAHRGGEVACGGAVENGDAAGGDQRSALSHEFEQKLHQIHNQAIH